ncbi:MAG TPA: PKD domain-containing protein, partial [Candidatus Eisenbacteria bacterium]|nr:PKD domain-containing protein [Candidatus Eisenbacteria bacterium]
MEVQFTDRSDSGTSPITERTWSFGDGSTSSELNPLHLYPAAGSYTVSLRLRTKDGTDLEERAAFIVVAPGVRAAAEFQAAPRSGEKPLSVQFTDQSTPGTGTITSWSWSFGDGQTSTAKDPVHVYQSDGTYDVSLTVQSPAGTATTTKSDYIVVSSAPAAAFTGSPRSGFTPLSVQFIDQSTAGSSPITSWAWSFGDGGASAVQSPSHV